MDRVDYSKDGKYIAVAGKTSKVDILNATTYSLIISISVLLGNVYRADFRDDSQMMLLCGYNTTNLNVIFVAVSNWSVV